MTPILDEEALAHFPLKMLIASEPKMEDVRLQMPDCIYMQLFAQLKEERRRPYVTSALGSRAQSFCKGNPTIPFTCHCIVILHCAATVQLCAGKIFHPHQSFTVPTPLRHPTTTRHTVLHKVVPPGWLGTGMRVRSAAIASSA